MQRILTAAGAETERTASVVPFIEEKTSAVSREKRRKSLRKVAVIPAWKNRERMNGKREILLSSVIAAIWSITEIPEKDKSAPEITMELYPSISPQEKTPPVTSKIPERMAFKTGEETTEKIFPPKAISRIPQEIIIKAHIRKQLSAAEIMDSTAQEELLFR